MNEKVDKALIRIPLMRVWRVYWDNYIGGSYAYYRTWQEALEKVNDVVRDSGSLIDFQNSHPQSDLLDKLGFWESAHVEITYTWICEGAAKELYI